MVSQLLTQPGVLDADTKTYLYLEPGRYLRQSATMWDPGVGLGTVTHQQLGYLFPMGPFFWATHALGIPAWAAQRLWVGAILFAAGAGVLFLARTLGLDTPGRAVAALAYALSPYALQYIGHISVILLAFAALPWLVALVERGTGGGWRHPAAIALVVAAMGSVNATSALYVAVGPVVWLAYAGLTRLHRWAALWRVAWRVTLMSVLVCLWWLVGLAVEGHYGLDVLRYTETVQAVSTTSLSSEVVRGLGYWYFYGGDNFGPWVSALPQYTEQLWLIAAGYAVPVLAVAGAFVTRWRHRTAFVVMALVGMVLAVGAYPFAHPSPAGAALKALLTGTKLGLGLRSTDRATPLVLLALAMLLGAAVTGLARRAPMTGLAVALAGAAVVVVANPSLWNGASVPTSFVQPPVATYERQAAAALDARGGSAVLGLPGQPFASTFAGTTVDPVWPALLRRPFVTREQQVMGSLPTEDLLYAMDDPIQSGTTDPAALVQMARLVGAGDLLLQNDLAFTRYDQPDPAVLWAALQPGTPGLGTPAGFGRVRRSLPPAKVVDEQTLTLPPSTPPMPALAVLPVAAPRPQVRAESAEKPVVVDGDAVGVDALAGTGLLRGSPTILYAGTLDTDAAARRAALVPGATLVVTDSNRRQAFRWDNLQNVAGATLAAGQAQPDSPENQPLDLFPHAPADAQTTTAVEGVASVTASQSGNAFQYLPEDRPAEAIDGNPDTAWQVGPFLDPAGQWWQVTLGSRQAADAVTLLQPQLGTHNQWITAVTLRFDGRRPVHAELGPASRRPGGQVVRFSSRSFRTLRITIDATNVPLQRALGGGVSAVGLAEVTMAGVHATEQVVMPQDLLRAAGARAAGDRLLVAMTRLRVSPATTRSDPEAALDRTLWLPGRRMFTLTGTARLDALASDSVVDQVTGRLPGTPAGVQATSSGRLAGDPAATASAALDGDPTTAWQSPLGDGHQVGQSLHVDLPAPVSFDHLDLDLVADGRHSVPSRLRITTEHGGTDVSLPALARRRAPDATAPVHVSFAPLTGAHVTITVTGVRAVRSVDYFEGSKTALPVAIAELGIPGVRLGPHPAALPAPCRHDLLSIDGRPVWISVSGASAAALSGGSLGVRLCGPDAGGLGLGPGSHRVVATPGTATGVDLDQVVLDSAAGGTPLVTDGPAAVAPAPQAPAPAVRVLEQRATHLEVRVGPSPNAPADGVWLVLGESVNDGWTATVSGGPSLGPPRLVDGFANGWLVPAPLLAAGRPLTVTLDWRPQGVVDAGLVVSAAAGALCLVLVAWPRRRRRDPAVATAAGAAPAFSAPWSTVPGAPDLRRVATAAVAAGVLAGVATSPGGGAVVAAVLVVAALVPRGRVLLAAAATSLVLATAITMVVVEATGHYYGNGQWVSHFGAANSLTWLGLSILLADLFLPAARRDGRSGPGARPRRARGSGRRSSPS